MNRGISLTELAATIERQQALKLDLIAPTSATTLTLGKWQNDIIPQITIEGQGSFPINHTAHRQLASRLNIPAAYYDRMLKEAPELLVSNANEWLGRADENRLIRTLDGNARAYLSDRYQRIDNQEIAEIALPVLAAIPDVQIVSSQITERRMYIQAVAPRIQGEVRKGDAVQAGVVISNSEIGHGSVSVQALIWRLVCLNGMIAPDATFRAYHVGRKVEDNAALWADDTRQADDRAVLLKVRDMVAVAVDEARFGQRLAQLEDLSQVRVSGNPARVVEVLAKKVGMSEGEGGGILRSLIEGGDLSAWGVLNAVTAQAHTAAYDRAVEIEVIGGRLIDLPPQDWQNMLAAA
jgi:hypothetical protein